MALLLRAATVAALATFAVACGGEDTSAPDSFSSAIASEPDQSALRDLIRAASAPPTAAEQPTTETGQDTQLKTENGVSQECVYKHFTGTALYETLVSFDPNADSIWPGAGRRRRTGHHRRAHAARGARGADRPRTSPGDDHGERRHHRWRCGRREVQPDR